MATGQDERVSRDKMRPILPDFRVFCYFLLLTCFRYCDVEVQVNDWKWSGGFWKITFERNESHNWGVPWQIDQKISKIHPASLISTKRCLWDYLGRCFSLWHFQLRQSNGLRDIARGNFQVPIKTNIFISRYLIKGFLDGYKYPDWNNFNEPNLYLTILFEKFEILIFLHFLEILKMILHYVAI